MVRIGQDREINTPHKQETNTASCMKVVTESYFVREKKTKNGVEN